MLFVVHREILTFTLRFFSTSQNTFIISVFFFYNFRSTIPEEEMNEIFSEIYTDLQELDVQRKKLKRKRTFVKPTKLA